MEAATFAKTHKLSTARNTSSNHLRLQKADAPSFSSKQSSHQTKRNNKKLPSTGFKQQSICTPLAPTRNQIIYKTASSDGPNSGSGKPSQNRLRSKGPSFIETKTLRFCNLDTTNFKKMNLNMVPKMGPPGGPIFGTACTA